MDEVTATDLARETLITAIKIVTPALLVGMVIGLVMSVLQTITSIQEQTLSVVPKILAVAGTLLVLLPWTLQVLLDFTSGLFASLARIGS